MRTALLPNRRHASPAWRLDQPDRLSRLLTENRAELGEAPAADFKTVRPEQDLEVGRALAAIVDARANLAVWMHPEPVEPPPAFPRGWVSRTQEWRHLSPAPSRGQSRGMAITESAEPKIVLVTGASSGIGRATAVRLAADGHHVVLGARRKDRLDAVAEEIRAAGGGVDVRALEVTDRADMASFVDQAVQEHGRVDVLVANAGVMPLSRLDALLVDEWDRMVDVNVKGLLYGIAAVLPHFGRQGGGHVVTVASIGAHQVSPTSAVYSGTKYAAWAITEGLRLESDPGIRVTTISPGVVESELAESITDPDTQELMRTYRANTISPDAIAGAIAYAVGQPADVDVNEIIIRPTRQR